MEEHKTSQIPSPAPRQEFHASKREIITALLMYGVAYLYIWQSMNFLSFESRRGTVWLVVFTVLIVSMTEILLYNTKRTRESWIWLGCIVVVEAAALLERCNAWDSLLSSLFVHVCFIWWVLSRSDIMLEGETGHMLPVDAATGFLLPFRFFYLRILCVIAGLQKLWRQRRRAKLGNIGWSLVALVLAAVFFMIAVKLLGGADTNFHRKLAKFMSLLQFRKIDLDRLCKHIFWFALSLPTAAWLFGLIAGSARVDRQKLHQRAEKVNELLRSLRKVPTGIWVGLSAAFCALYAFFFTMHTPYLLGAFSRSLPAGYTVAQYAREGFFELCKIMAINFILLWLITRMSRSTVQGHKGLKIISLILLAESLLFAVIAASKLWLYIDCFGFTPRRLESAWLICSLAFGCLCSIWSILRQKKAIRAWMIFSAVTMSLLHLY